MDYPPKAMKTGTYHGYIDYHKDGGSIAFSYPPVYWKDQVG